MSDDDFMNEEEELDLEKKLKSQRANVHRIMLPADLDMAIVKQQAKMETGKSSTILWMLNEQAFQLSFIKPEAHRLLAKRYSRKLVDVVAERTAKRENSNVPVLSREKQKEQQILEQKNKQFRGMIEQWDNHPSEEWRSKVIADAEKWKDRLQSARDLITLQERG